MVNIFELVMGHFQIATLVHSGLQANPNASKNEKEPKGQARKPGGPEGDSSKFPKLFPDAFRVVPKPKNKGVIGSNQQRPHNTSIGNIDGNAIHSEKNNRPRDPTGNLKK